jgi:hypothetical protein
MTEFFNDKTFLNRLNQLKYDNVKILEIMNRMKQQNPELPINTFICIAEKMKDRSVVCMTRSGYKTAVELWNQFVFDNYKCDFDLLISYKDLCF